MPNAFSPQSEHPKDGTPVIQPTRIFLPDQLVVGNRHLVKQQIVDLIAHGFRDFVVDFSQCGYVDTTGLGILVSCSKKIREAGGELVLEELNDDMLTLFELTNLSTLFTIRRAASQR
ncbi:MAG TPA: STAS domain-containing protein [Gemmatimonadaceae bacterium]|nr:STAS domain-containing protein [Gemmatimonadaceae bacterium]